MIQQSHIWRPDVIDDIQTKAQLGRYRYRGLAPLLPRPLPSFDDLTFIPASLTRVPLEGYREKCSTKTVLGTRFARRPIELEIPMMVTGMSFGALSYNAKVALARAANVVGTSTTTGDGGMLMAERENSKTLVYQVLPSRYGFNIHHLKMADAVEIVIGQGAKPGTGGVLLGAKVSEAISKARDLPLGVDQRSPCRHPDFMGPDDMVAKIDELREATDWQLPIFVKLGATRVFDDVKLAAKAGADVVVVDGMEGGTGASPDILIDHTGIPTLAAVCEARAALEDIGLYGEVQLIIAGGIRSGPDAAKALSLGADAVYMGTATLVALNCNKPIHIEDYHKLGTEPYHCHHCHTGRCPVGITTQDPELVARLEIDAATDRVVNLFNALTAEIQMLARSCGKADIHDMESEDLRALSLEASMITGVPLVGTNKVFGGGPGWKQGDTWRHDRENSKRLGLVDFSLPTSYGLSSEDDEGLCERAQSGREDCQWIGYLQLGGTLVSLRHDDGWNIPADAPFYPPLPAVYRNVKFHFLFFAARSQAVSYYLPEPLEPHPDGTCVVSGIDVPFCTNYGPFQEAFLVLKCKFRGQVGYYCSHVLHTGPAGIAAGREIYGTPKVFARLSVKKMERSMLTEASMGALPILRLSTITEQVVPSSVMPALTPSWRLKVIPRADGPGPAIKQLIDCSHTTQDQVVHFFARGKGTLTLAGSPFLDLSPLQPLSCGDAFYMECDYSEHYAEVVYDYLTQK